jgi:hypothetical protein
MNSYFLPGKRRLIFPGMFFIVASVVVFYLHFDREKINSKADIAIIRGPFEEYSWISHGVRGGSSFTFKLRNYSNRFKIKADFFPMMQTDKFTGLSYGEPLSIGISKSSLKYLNTAKEPFFVYSIASSGAIYLDLNKAIEKHNSPVFLFAGALFAFTGCALIYMSGRAKAKTV